MHTQSNTVQTEALKHLLIKANQSSKHNFPNIQRSLKRHFLVVVSQNLSSFLCVSARVNSHVTARASANDVTENRHKRLRNDTDGFKDVIEREIKWYGLRNLFVITSFFPEYFNLRCIIVLVRIH